MSLKTFLTNPDVREKLSSEFEKPKLQVKKEIVASPLTKHYGLVGTAFDYLLRFHIEYWNPQCVEKHNWVAEGALHYLEDKYLELGQRLIDYAKRNLKRFLKSGECDFKLIESALLLAGLDTIFRTRLGIEDIGLVDEQDVEDLRKLISAVDMQIFKAQNRVILNPNFGKVSLLVGGADADLIIDDMLVDIKTTKNLELTKEYFHQLIGYLTLYYLSGDVEHKKSLPRINTLAVYFSRYAFLYVIPVEALATPEKLLQFGEWFLQRAKADKPYQKFLK